MLGILWMIAIGFIIGVLAQFFRPSPTRVSFLFTTMIGIGGAVIAGSVGQFFGWYDSGQTVGFFSSVVGAIILLFIANNYYRLTGRKQ